MTKYERECYATIARIKAKSANMGHDLARLRDNTAMLDAEISAAKRSAQRTLARCAEHRAKWDAYNASL